MMSAATVEKPCGPNTSLIALVAQAGSVSSFIDPDRSTTNAMSRGLAMATARACVENESCPKILPKNKGLVPLGLLVEWRGAAAPALAPGGVGAQAPGGG